MNMKNPRPRRCRKIRNNPLPEGYPSNKNPENQQNGYWGILLGLGTDHHIRIRAKYFLS